VSRFLDTAAVFGPLIKVTYEDLKPKPVMYLDIFATTVRFDAPESFDTVLK
jgi:hypothetical protein